MHIHDNSCMCQACIICILYISNSMVLSAIWEKPTQVSFSKSKDDESLASATSFAGYTARNEYACSQV